MLSSLRRPSPSLLRQLSTRPHPLASKATPRGPVLAGQTPPSLQSRQQKWSTLTALIIATFTGATTFVVGLQTGKGDSAGETKLAYREPTQEGFKSGMKGLESFLPEDCIAQDRASLLAHGHSDWACECERVGVFERGADGRRRSRSYRLAGRDLVPSFDGGRRAHRQAGGAVRHPAHPLLGWNFSRRCASPQLPVRDAS